MHVKPYLFVTITVDSVNQSLNLHLIIDRNGMILELIKIIMESNKSHSHN